MELLATLSDFDWIAEGIPEIGSGMNITVAHCLPPMYSSYVKILHSIHEDLAIQDKQLTWNEDEAIEFYNPEPQSEIGKTIAGVLGRSTLVYGGADRDACLRRIRWAELAGSLGMPFTPLISAASFTRQFSSGSWPRHLIGPMEGCLTDPERDALTSVLRSSTRVDRIFFRFWILATTRWENDKVFQGTLDEVNLFPDGGLGAHLTPTHWFPEDRSWIVCSDYDLTFSLVGGEESLIRRLLEDPVLECVRVSSTTRVDTHADLERATR